MRDKFLVLAGTCASRLSLPTVAAACRKRILDHNPQHMVGHWETIREALAASDFRQYLGQLLRTYPLEKAEHMLDCLGIQPGRERQTYSDEEEYAAALLGTSVAAMRRVAADPDAALEVDSGHVLETEEDGDDDGETEPHGRRLQWDDSQVYIVEDEKHASVLDTQEINLNDHDTVSEDRPEPAAAVDTHETEIRTLVVTELYDEPSINYPDGLAPPDLDSSAFSSMSLALNLDTGALGVFPQRVELPSEQDEEWRVRDFETVEDEEQLSGQILLFLGVAAVVFLSVIGVLVALQ